MLKLLVTTALIAATAGMASADVTLSGDARMGIVDDFGDVGPVFNSRARVKFTMSGETDTGLTFGAEFRANDAAGAASGTAGSVFVSGGFGKLSMGDVDGASHAAAGNVDGVGLTGLGDLNEIAFLGDGGADEVLFDARFAGSEPISGDPSILYEYTTGSLSLYASANQLNFVLPVSGTDSKRSIGVAAAYTMGNYKLSLGYDMVKVGIGVTTWDIDQVTVGADATLGAIVLKARYATGAADGSNGFAQDNDQWAISGTYTMDALALTAFVSSRDFSQAGISIVEREGYGIGASYDLGGGAKVVAGYAKNKTADTNALDLGLSFSF